MNASPPSPVSGFYVYQEPDGRWSVYLYGPNVTGAESLWRRLDAKSGAAAFALKDQIQEATLGARHG
jgi:hypothetical protein